MSIKFLKVKVKSLAEESRIIRREERKLHGQDNIMLRNELHLHRVFVVRKAARETHLAYGFLRGRMYQQMEKGTDKYRQPDWTAVAKMVKKYGLPSLSSLPLDDVLKLIQAWEGGDPIELKKAS